MLKELGSKDHDVCNLFPNGLAKASKQYEKERERERERERDFKKVAYATVRAWKSKVHREGLDIFTGVNIAVLSLKAVWRQNSFFFWGSQSFFLRPSTDFMSPIYIMKRNLFHSKSTDLKVNHI